MHDRLVGIGVRREMGVRVVFPPPRYCTDNGVMIAWNGIEKYRRYKVAIDKIKSYYQPK